MMKPVVAEPSTNASTQKRTELLRVKHLNVDYETGDKPVHAVNDVSFTLHRGQILGLAGESGSGKSTLAYAITRLLHPPAVITGGEILYYPRDEQAPNMYKDAGGRKGLLSNTNKAEGDRKGLLSNTNKAEGDRKGPHPALPHPRPYNDYEDGLAGGLHAGMEKDAGDRKGPHPAPPHPRPYNDYEGSRGGGGVNEGRGPLWSPAFPPVDILQLSKKELRAFRWQELAIVFQSAMNALNPVMRLETQIADVLEAHNPSMGREERRQRALELLRLVGITPDRLRSYAHELSGGMRQRAIIAIALALNPEIIIMDEPTTALDVVVQRDILVELMALREHLNFAVIFITHDLSLLLEVADQVAIMYAGRIVEEASWQELYRHPRHPYSYGLLNSFPSLHGPKRRMSGIPGSPPDLRNVPAGCAFRPRCSFALEECGERLPALAAPLLEGVHIGAQGLEPDGKLKDAIASKRFQQSQVACHLYSKEEASNNE